MSWQSIISCLSFSKKERTGITVLMVLIFLFSAAPLVFPLIIPKTVIVTKDYDEAIKALSSNLSDSSSELVSDQSLLPGEPGNSGKIPVGKTVSGLFYFDPNTASARDWQELGVADHTIRTIQHYLEKGGRFRQPADIAKIWGMKPDQAQRLMSFVRIVQASQEKPLAGTTANLRYNAPGNLEYRAGQDRQSVDVNQADSAAWEALPGIGERLSQRIVSFREKLGGFYATDQVAETFGLADSVYQKIRPRLSLSGSPLKKININTANIETLKQHPYIRYALANAIVQYRNQHGNFKTTRDLLSVMLVTEEKYRKLEPYLETGQPDGGN